MLEGSQGCGLSLNHSGNHPYVTSRNVSSGQLVADSGISPERLLQTLMVIRPFPIRISNITKTGEIIYTGNFGTGEELVWTQTNLAAMFGGYPFKGDVECYTNHLTVDKLKRIIAHCPEIYLKQVLGENYKSKRLENVTLLQALELERLMYKSKGLSIYETKLIELPAYSSEFGPNTIVDQSEQTTVTEMERRILDLDIEELKMYCKINTPSSLYLNFFEHLGLDYKGQTGNFEDYYFNRYLREYFDWLESKTDVPISVLGTGPKNNERILKMQPIKDVQII